MSIYEKLKKAETICFAANGDQIVMYDQKTVRKTIKEIIRSYPQNKCKGNCSASLGYKGNEGCDCMAECGCPADKTWFNRNFEENTSSFSEQRKGDKDGKT